MIWIKELCVKAEPKLIGGGGNSKVYECFLEDDHRIQKVILKVGANIEQNITNYGIIKSLNIPTLDFVRIGKYLNKPTLITNHLNVESQPLIFVTPNSVITEEQRMLSKLDTFNNTKIIEPIAENFRYKNKLTCILNLEDFIQEVLNDINKASDSKVVIEFDSYFVGSQKLSEKSEICYKIADLDNIYKCNDKTKEECLEINKKEFLKMLTEFIIHFVKKGLNKKKYLKYLNDKITLPNNVYKSLGE